LFDKGGYPQKIELFSINMSKSYNVGCGENFQTQKIFTIVFISKNAKEAVNKVRYKEDKEWIL